LTAGRPAARAIRTSGGVVDKRRHQVEAHPQFATPGAEVLGGKADDEEFVPTNVS